MWILFAFGAALFWGLTYVFREQVYKHISVYTSLGLTALCVSIIVLGISFFSGNLIQDLKTLSASREALRYFLLALGVLIVAELCIGFSITHKNATLAGIVEISYPIFIALFSFILFKVRVPLATIVGALIVFVGIGIIYYFNK